MILEGRPRRRISAGTPPSRGPTVANSRDAQMILVELQPLRRCRNNELGPLRLVVRLTGRGALDILQQLPGTTDLGWDITTSLTNAAHADSHDSRTPDPFRSSPLMQSLPVGWPAGQPQELDWITLQKFASTDRTVPTGFSGQVPPPQC